MGRKPMASNRGPLPPYHRSYLRDRSKGVSDGYRRMYHPNDSHRATSSDHSRIRSRATTDLSIHPCRMRSEEGALTLFGSVPMARATPPSDKVGDKEGHVVWHRGQPLCDGRYVIRGLLGEGTFGRVFECDDYGATHKRYDDKKALRKVAIKVVRAIDRYIAASKIEGDILQSIGERELGLKRRDGTKQTNVLRLLDEFMQGQHHCLVFNRLGPSLYDFMKQNKYKGYFVQDIATIARDCLTALAFLQEHCDELAHTDLKPENILLASNERIEVPVPRQTMTSDGPEDLTTWRPYPNSRVQIVDFGSAVFKQDHCDSLINTRQYRSPEVLLGLKWSHKSDIWSLGCILAELYTGNLLFNTTNHQEHLAMIQKSISNLPEWMLKAFYERRNPMSSKYQHRSRERLKDDEAEVADDYVSDITANRIAYEEKRNAPYPNNTYMQPPRHHHRHSRHHHHNDHNDRAPWKNRDRSMSASYRKAEGLIRSQNGRGNEVFPTRRYEMKDLLTMINDEVPGGHRGLTLFRLDYQKLTDTQWQDVLACKPLEKHFRACHRDLYDFIRCMLVTDCRVRPDASTLLNHPFLNTNNLIERDEATLRFLLGPN